MFVTLRMLDVVFKLFTLELRKRIFTWSLILTSLLGGRTTF